MPENCNPKDCPGLVRAEEVAGDVRALDQKLAIFQQSATETINKFGGRIGKLEAHNEVQDEKLHQMKEAQADVKKAVDDARREQKDSIADLKTEQGKAMGELKKSNKEILEAVTPIKHKVESMEDDQKKLSADVEKIKGEDGETWKGIKKQILAWGVAVVLAIIAAALGLSKFL